MGDVMNIRIKRIEIDTDLANSFKIFWQDLKHFNFGHMFSHLFFQWETPISKIYRGLYCSFFGVSLYVFTDKMPPRFK